MLTGRNPFLGSDNISTMSAILKEQPKSLSEAGKNTIPEEAERILSRCLRKDPERRFQTASDLRAALEDLLEEFSDNRPVSTVAPRRRWGVLWSVSATSVVIITW